MQRRRAFVSTRPCVRNIIDALPVSFSRLFSSPRTRNAFTPFFLSRHWRFTGDFLLFAGQPLQKRLYTRRLVSIYKCNCLRNYSSFKKCPKFRLLSAKDYFQMERFNTSKFLTGRYIRFISSVEGSLIVYRWYGSLITFVPDWNLVAHSPQNTNLI